MSDANAQRSAVRLLPSFPQAVAGLAWLWIGLLVAVPTALVVAASFLNRGQTAFVEGPPTLANYRRLLDPLYFDVFRHSLAMAGLSTTICIAAGYPFAWIVSRMGPRARPAMMFLVIVPFWTNSLVRTYAMKLLLATNGLVNTALQGLGLVDEPLRMLYTEGAVVVGLVYVLLPFAILPLYAVFEQLPRELLQASADLGAGRARTFLRVVLPITMPGVVAACLLTLLPGMGLFYVSDLLGGAKNLLVGNVVKNQFLDARDWPFGAAASVTLTLAMGVLLVAYRWSAKRVGMKDGG